MPVGVMRMGFGGEIEGKFWQMLWVVRTQMPIVRRVRILPGLWELRCLLFILKSSCKHA